MYRLTGHDTLNMKNGVNGLFLNSSELLSIHAANNVTHSFLFPHTARKHGIIANVQLQ